jgi:hypothetical protein
MLPTSVFRMRMDLPSERAASGSFFDPNSTISTMATISTFQGLSNRSPIMSILYQQGDVLSARVYTVVQRGDRFRRRTAGNRPAVFGPSAGSRDYSERGGHRIA